MAIVSRKKSSFRAECSADENPRLCEAKSIEIDLSPKHSGLRFSRDDDDTQRTKKPRCKIGASIYLLNAIIRQSS